MADLYLLKATNGDFFMPRADLEKHDYFRAMLQLNPPFLTLPFPSRIVEDVVGVVQHGSEWTCSTDPNVYLALKYCMLLDETGPERTVERAAAEEVPVKKTSFPVSADINEIISSLELECPKISTREISSINLTSYKPADIKLVAIADPNRAIITLEIGTKQIFRVTPELYSSVFSVYTHYLVFNEQLLALINRSTLAAVLNLSSYAKITVVTDTKLSELS